jgi:hypothetical protein
MRDNVSVSAVDGAGMNQVDVIATLKSWLGKDGFEKLKNVHE